MGELEDTKSIIELIFHYAYLTDHKLHGRVSTEIFSEDAVVHVGSGVFSGRDSIHEYYRQGQDALAAMMHQYTNVSVDVDENRARSRAYVTTWMWSHDSANRGSVRPADFAAVGVYVDLLRRTQEGWRIYSRTMHPLGTSGLGVGSPPSGFESLFEGLSAIGPSNIVSPWPPQD